MFVALLRNIGPATHARMRLGALAAACGAAGLEAVASIGNTGNLVFASGRPRAEARAIVAAAVRRFGVDSEVFIRTRRQIDMLVGTAPFADAAAAHPAHLGVCFFHAAPGWPPSYRDYPGPERLARLSSHLVVDYRGRAPSSRLSIERTVGRRMTQRNWTTVLRIAARMGAG